MPNLNEFIGPTPAVSHKSELEKIIGSKPCSKCDENVSEAYWDPTTLIMSWTCSSGHDNTVKIN